MDTTTAPTANVETTSPEPTATAADVVAAVDQVLAEAMHPSAQSNAEGVAVKVRAAVDRFR